MTRFLIFIASVCVGCTLISSTASASPAEWTHAGRASDNIDDSSAPAGATLSLTMSIRSAASYGPSVVMP